MANGALKYPQTTNNLFRKMANMGSSSRVRPLTRLLLSHLKDLRYLEIARFRHRWSDSVRIAVVKDKC